MPAASRSAAVDYTLSDLELLGGMDDTQTESSPPGAAVDRERAAHGRKEGSAAVSPQQAGEAVQDADNQQQNDSPKGAAEQQTTPEEAPETLAEFAAAFALPEVGPKLREICQREGGYRKVFPTVEEARAVREVFANAEAARAAAAAQSELARLDALVESRDPRGMQS
jgi:hypothetical protein